jgi:tellurite resistance protein TehA-like permease
MESTAVDESSVPAPALPPTTASLQTTNTGPYTYLVYIYFVFVLAFFSFPFASLLICCIFFLYFVTPQTKESSDAPPSVMIISPPSIKDKDQACVGSTCKADTLEDML